MDPRVTVVIKLMHDLLTEQPSMGALSKRVNLSPIRMRQLFKKETGQTASQYVRRLRLREAEKLLRTTFLTIKEVTFLCGMNDVSHFARDFKKEYSKTPSQYRAEWAQRASTVPTDENAS